MKILGLYVREWVSTQSPPVDVSSGNVCDMATKVLLKGSGDFGSRVYKYLNQVASIVTLRIALTTKKRETLRKPVNSEPKDPVKTRPPQNRPVIKTGPMIDGWPNLGSLIRGSSLN